MPDRGRVIDMLAGLAELLGIGVSAERLIGYVAALDDLSDGQIALACRRAARESQFFPRPAELRHFVVSRHPQTHWPAGWREHCPHGTCAIPTQCPEAWAWCKAVVLAEHPELASEVPA
jgi:hypothetical protein